MLILSEFLSCFAYIFLLLSLTLIVNVAVEDIKPDRNGALVNVCMRFWCYFGGSFRLSLCYGAVLHKHKNLRFCKFGNGLTLGP